MKSKHAYTIFLENNKLRVFETIKIIYVHTHTHPHPHMHIRMRARAHARTHNFIFLDSKQNSIYINFTFNFLINFE